MAPIPIKTENGARLGDVEFIWAVNSKEFFFSNSIFIRDDRPTLVDPSANFSYLERLAAQKKVSQVLNTHYHVDHRSLNSLFSHATFMCHKFDHKALMSFEDYLKYADSERASGYVNWLKGIFSNLDIKESYFSILLKDGDLLPLDGQEVEVIHLPGHTPGHIGLFFKDIDTLYTSDVDLTPLGPWYANISSSIEDFLKSLARLKNFECTYYVSSHGGRIYDRERFLIKLERFTSAFEKRDNKILEALAQNPQHIEELSQLGIIYRKTHLRIDPLKASFERQMIGKHLERLRKLGKVHKAEKKWGLT